MLKKVRISEINSNNIFYLTWSSKILSIKYEINVKILQITYTFSFIISLKSQFRPGISQMLNSIYDCGYHIGQHINLALNIYI